MFACVCLCARVHSLGLDLVGCCVASLFACVLVRSLVRWRVLFVNEFDYLLV